nr:RidA family protein [Glycomyces salinus]
MVDITASLERMGLTLPQVVPPVAAYRPAVVSGTYVYVSGQLPIVEGELVETGKVGAEVSPERAYELARTCALNGLAAALSVAPKHGISRIVKVVGFVASAPGFSGQPGVVNGASEFLGEVLGGAGEHARSAVGVSELPLNAPVEVELIAETAPTAKVVPV